MFSLPFAIKTEHLCPLQSHTSLAYVVMIESLLEILHNSYNQGIWWLPTEGILVISCGYLQLLLHLFLSVSRFLSSQEKWPHPKYTSTHTAPNLSRLSWKKKALMIRILVKRSIPYLQKRLTWSSHFGKGWERKAEWVEECQSFSSCSQKRCRGHNIWDSEI